MVEEINAGDNLELSSNSINKQKAVLPTKPAKGEIAQFKEGQEVNHCGSCCKVTKVKFSTNTGCYFYTLQPLPPNGNPLRLVSEYALLRFNPAQ